jgi:hypothetical protein
MVEIPLAINNFAQFFNPSFSFLSIHMGIITQSAQTKNEAGLLISNLKNQKPK